MRVKVTTEIDINLKMQYEAVRGQRSKTYRDILEAGIIAELKEMDPIGATMARIELREKENAEDRNMLARLRILEPAQKRIPEFEGTETARQSRIEDWLQELEPGSLRMIQKGAANWTRIAPEIGAATARQAQEWVMEVVKSWKAKHESQVVS